MAKEPAKLADFKIPRNEGTPELAVAAHSRASDVDVVLPVRITPRPPAEARQAMTIRLPLSMHERIRTLMYTSRRSQQEIVEAALDVFLAANE